MKTVYFIYNSYKPNNAANNRALAYLRALSTLDFKIKVLYIMPDERFSRITDSLPGISIEYYWEKNYIKNRLFKNFSYILYLYKIYHRVQPGDIVYLYGGVDLLWLLTRKAGVKVFYERTEHPLVHPAKGRICHPSIKRYLSYCRKVEGVFVITTCLRDYFVENGIHADKVTIVNSIVDTSRFDGLVKQPCEPYFAYCGNGNNRKDKVDELIRVFARVANRHSNIKFYIIGPTKQVYKNEQDNVQLVHQLGLDDRVVFTGMKSSREIPQLLVNATALFLTRPDTLQNRAGFSTKLGEYLASGNPVVAAGVGDIPLFLKDRQNAFVYSPDNHEALEGAMEYILTHPEDAQRIGIAGRATAHRHFNALIEAKKLIALFQ